MAAGAMAQAKAEADEYTLPPFLRRVRIRSYKSIGFCDVHLQPLSILVGRNAAGKSNFLDALAFLRDTMESGVAEAVKRRNNWTSIVCRTSESQKIEIEVAATFTCPPRSQRNNNGPSAIGQPGGGPLADLAGTTFDATYCLEFTQEPHSPTQINRETLEISDEAKRLTGGFEVHNGIIQRWRSKPNSSAPLALPHSVELLEVQRRDFPLLAVIGTQPFVEFGESLRTMGFYNTHPNTIRAVQKINPGRMLEKDGRNLPSVVDGLAEIESESVQRVKDYLTAIAEEVQDFAVVRYGDFETIRFRIRSGSSDPAMEFDADAMSDGTLRALATLMAAFQIVLPHRYPSVIGIEEPETALHPSAIRALVDALDESTQRSQIILTTHSAELLAGRDIGPGQVLVVRNRGGQSHITPVDPASQEIIQKELYSLADLQRMDKLDLDETDLKRQIQVSRQGGA